MAEKNPSKDGALDQHMEISDATKTQTQETEAQVLLRYLLGVDLSVDLTDNAKRKQVTIGIASQICNARKGISFTFTEAQLGDLLDKRIDEALKVISPDTELYESQIAEVLANAIYKEVPRDMMNAFIANRMTPFSSVENGRAEIISTLVTFPPNASVATALLGGALGPGSPSPIRVSIDLSNPFWKGKKLNDKDSLIKELTGPAIKNFGIRIAGVSENQTLDKEDAQAITDEDWTVVRLGNNYGSVQQTDSIDGTDIEWNLDIDQLIALRTDNNAPDSPTDLRNRSIGSLTRDDLTRVLLHDEKNWRKFVPNLAMQGLDAFTVQAPGVPLAEFVANQIFARAGRTPGEPLAGVRIQLHEVQQEVSEQAAIYKRLSDGSQNYMGAALAAAMIMRNPQLRGAAILGDAALQEEIKKLEAKKKIHESLKKLEEKAEGPTIKKLDGGVSLNYQLLAKEKTDLETDIKNICKVGISDWKSDFVENSTEFLNEPQAYKNGTPDERREMKDAKNSIAKRLKEVDAELNRYKNIEKMLKAMRRDVLDGKYTSAASSTLTSYFKDFDNSADIEPTAITADFDPQDVAHTIKKQLEAFAEPLEDITKLDELLAEKRLKANEIKKGGLAGDDLQRKVFAEGIKIQHPGTNEDDAKAGANYLWSRSFTDGELDKGLGSAIDNLFEDEDKVNWKKENRVESIVGEIARACKIKVKTETTVVPPSPNPFMPTSATTVTKVVGFDWQEAKGDYPRLMLAYYSLKKLRDGGGPEHIRLDDKKTDFLNTQLKIIGKLLATNHLHSLEKHLGTDLSPQEKQDLKDKKGNYTWVLSTMLEGEAPADYRGKIDKLLEKVGKKIKPEGPGALERTKQLLWKNKILSAAAPVRGLFYGGVGTAKGIGIAGHAVGKVTGVNWVLQNKGRAALFAGLLLFGGPAAVLLYKGGEAIGGSASNHAPSR